MFVCTAWAPAKPKPKPRQNPTTNSIINLPRASQSNGGSGYKPPPTREERGQQAYDQFMKDHPAGPLKPNPSQQDLAGSVPQLCSDQNQVNALPCAAPEPAAPAAPPQGQAPPQLTPAQAAQLVMAKITYVPAGVGAGPNRAINGLDFDVPVGYPVWLWADGGDQGTRTVTDAAGGIAVRITVKFDGVDFDMGDGTTVPCQSGGTEWTKGSSEPAEPSPSCGHAYDRMGFYTITATTRWTITWTAGPDSGVAPMAMSDSRQWAVGEIQTIIR